MTDDILDSKVAIQLVEEENELEQEIEETEENEEEPLEYTLDDLEICYVHLMDGTKFFAKTYYDPEEDTFLFVNPVKLSENIYDGGVMYVFTIFTPFLQDHMLTIDAFKVIICETVDEETRNRIDEVLEQHFSENKEKPKETKQAAIQFSKSEESTKEVIEETKKEVVTYVDFKQKKKPSETSTIENDDDIPPTPPAA